MLAFTRRRNWAATLALIGLSAGIGVLILSSRSAAQPAPDASDVGKLQDERIATLREAAKFASELYGRGLATSSDVLRCNQMLVEAQLDAASGKQRIEVLQNAVTSAKEQEELEAKRYQAGLSTQLTSLETKAYRLRMEIELAKETAKQ